MKLWQKHTNLHEAVERFTVGRDREFDLLLAKHDVIGTLAHTEMLCSVGLLQVDEKNAIHKALNDILAQIEAGDFRIDSSCEDVHSQIELLLVAATGEAGKKIHSGRSRNDQVLTAIKLYLREALQETAQQVKRLFDQLLQLSETHREKLLPGYTHLQIAMPSSFGLWFAAYAESLSDDLDLLIAAHQLTNKNPLGSAAGYGSSFPIDRQLTTHLLNFDSLHVNSVYAQMTRGKTEQRCATALAAIAATLSKLAMDICLYCGGNYGFIRFPAELTTGSSIMPHKKNPDAWELIRAKCNRMQSMPNEFALLLTNLSSGYHRDLQLTKEILFPAITTLTDCLEMAKFMLEKIIVVDRIPDEEKYAHLYTVDAVNALVLKGVPFREAYRQVGFAVENGLFEQPEHVPHTHIGSSGNLGNELIKKSFEEKLEKIIPSYKESDMD